MTPASDSEIRIWIPDDYEEGPLHDNKRDLYGGLKHERKQADFIKDVIAMANTARLFGRPGIICMGIEDDGNPIGVEEELERFRTNENSSLFELRNAVYRVMRYLITEYIQPPLAKWELK
ncbi:MAG: putative DNA binding domain-containing protein, partial [Caldilineaceae bacterium]|nr:putative DNA binding domain-containing protein [Caldilineaceae bacterium]